MAMVQTEAQKAYKRAYYEKNKEKNKEKIATQTKEYRLTPAGKKAKTKCQWKRRGLNIEQFEEQQRKIDFYTIKIKKIIENIHFSHFCEYPGPTT